MFVKQNKKAKANIFIAKYVGYPKINPDHLVTEIHPMFTYPLVARVVPGSTELRLCVTTVWSV